jgi:hypothetical protein
MRRLRDLQLVHLHIGTRRLPARVLFLREHTAVLTGEAHRLAGAQRRPASLAFTVEGRLISLTGHLRAGPIPETTAFTTSDSAHLPDQRAQPRLPMRLDARLEFPDAPLRAPVDTTILDISAGGIGLEPVEIAVGARVTVHVSQPDGSLMLTTVVARCTPTGCGLQLTETPPHFAEAIMKALLMRRRIDEEDEEEVSRRRT